MAVGGGGGGGEGGSGVQAYVGRSTDRLAGVPHSRCRVRKAQSLTVNRCDVYKVIGREKKKNWNNYQQLQGY